MTLTIIVAVAVVMAMLGLGAATTNVGEWYRDLKKPAWTPPNWLFGPAWTVILGLAGWSGVLGWSHASGASDRAAILAAFGANIVLHLAWSPLFFNLRRPDWALIEVGLLWLSIAAMIVVVAPLSILGGWLLSPYLAWVSFAAILNLVIARANAPFGVRRT
jgi:tryptophan-rich sensory protein